MSSPSTSSAAKNQPKPAAVLFLAFNRPDLFSRVLAAVGEAGPREIFVAIDGPRAGRPDDVRLCAEVRQLAENIAWATRLHLKAEQKNLGCGPAVTSAIDWALAAVPELIIIEDDCLPDPSFFRLSDELLERYRDDDRVMQIAGTNWGAAAERYAGHSYAFTSFAPVWGWATWRRAWKLYDYALDSWPRVKASGLAEGMSLSTRFRRLLERDWEMVRAGGGTWDHQWQYAVLRHHGLSISPEHNLVVNLGFRADGTQIQVPDRIFCNLTTQPLSFPLQHPPEVSRSAAVEAVFEQVYWQKFGWHIRVYRWFVRSKRLHNIVRSVTRHIVPRPS